MMRNQRVSPDCLTLSNGRKSNLRTCKEDDGGENGRIPNYNISFEGKTAHRYRSGTTPSPSRDNNFLHFIVSDSTQAANHVASQNNQSHDNSSTSPSPSRGGDVLLQWGQNKRSRGSRAENRIVVADESSAESRQVIKIHRRVVPGVEKQGILNQTMPPPSSSATTSYGRGANLRSCTTPIRESLTGSLLNRNLEERSGARNGSPSSNGGGCSRVASRSADKRSPPLSDKTENKVGSCSGTTMGEKSNGSMVQADPTSHVESTPVPSEQLEATHVVTGEKLNLDIFEWPRIYISLSRKEKEDDFLVMKGTKLPQRPKKRAKNVDKTLQYCFPGMWLSDLTRGRYEVREKKCVKKQKRRGLKGMESMDSDSE